MLEGGRAFVGTLGGELKMLSSTPVLFFFFCPFRGCNKVKSKGFPRRFREVPSSGERGEKGSR